MLPPRKPRFPAQDGDAGFTILELVVAITLFALIVTALAASASSGLRLVTTSNGRQTATQLVVEQMEALRARTFDTLGHPAPLTRSADPQSPDHQVSADGASYDVPDIGLEPLAVDASFTTGHGPQQYVRNGTRYSLYRYVTQVDDAATSLAPDYKRVTIAVQWRGQAAPNIFTISSTFSRGSVEFKAVATTTPSATTTPPGPTTTSPTPTTTVAPCSDTRNPQGDMEILAQTGADVGYTRTAAITLELEIDDDCPATGRAFASNDGGPYTALNPGFTATATTVQVAWSIPSTNGSHTVSVYYADGAGRTSPVYSSTVNLDTTAPTAPASFTASKQTTTQGNKTTTKVVLSWVGTTDNDTLVGYRIYRKVGNVAAMTQYDVVAAGNRNTECRSGQACGFTDAAVSAGNQYTYAVAAYDAAGNETGSGEVSVSV